MTQSRRPARDLIDAILENMRANIEELRYTIVAPSRYAVYLSPAEYDRPEGLVPRLQAEDIRELKEELNRLNRGGRVRQTFKGWLGERRPVEIADTHWQVEFLPDLDGDLAHDQDILVQSDLVLPAAPELGGGERTRRVTTVRGVDSRKREDVVTVAATTSAATLARLSYTDDRGPHTFDIVQDETSIGRGGSRYPVDVRVATTDDVSREHARIRRDPSSGSFFLVDLSAHGTTLDGRPVPRGVDDREGTRRPNGLEAALGARNRIGLADRVFIEFERIR